MRSALTAMAHSSQALQLVKYFCRLIFSGFLISDLSRICACHVQRMCLKSFAANIEVYTQCWCRSWLFHLIDVQWLSVAAQRNDSKSPWSKAHKALLSRGCDIMWQDVARGEVTKCCRRSELTWCPTERLRSSLGMRAPYSTSPVISRRCTNTICVLGLAQAWCVGDLDSPNPSKRRAYLSEHWIAQIAQALHSGAMSTPSAQVKGLMTSRQLDEPVSERSKRLWPRTFFDSFHGIRLEFIRIPALFWQDMLRIAKIYQDIPRYTEHH